jgi:hypothetical protein
MDFISNHYMNRHSILSLVMALAFTGAVPAGALAQSIDIQEAGSSDQTNVALTNFSSLGGGDYTLPHGGAWVNNLSSNNTADLNVALPNFNSSAGGWVFAPKANNANIGNIWLSNASSVSNPGILLGDPMIAYSVAFQNTTSTDQTFTLTLTVPINPSLTYSLSSVRATVAGSVVDGGGAPGFAFTPALPGGFLQTASLTTPGGPISADVDLTSGTITSSVSGGNDIIGPITTPGYNGYIPGPSGTFTALTLNVGVTLSAGDFAALTGRVDVIAAAAVPEPSSLLLFALGGMLTVAFFRSPDWLLPKSCLYCGSFSN